MTIFVDATRLTQNIRAGRAYVEVTADTSKLQRGLSQAQAQLAAFGRTCTALGRDLLTLSGALAVPLALSARSFASFDDSMRMAQAVTRATADELGALTETAQRLGRTTSFTAQQVADAMVAMGRMGLSPAEIDSSISAVLNLSRATGTDLSQATDIAANSLRIFGLRSEQMADVSDVLTAAANGSAQTLTDLFEALKMAGPQAKAAGEDIRETAAALGVLANVGIKGSLAGTALRKSFAQFSQTKIQEKLARVGVVAVDANGNLRKTADVIRDIAAAMQSMGTAERIAFAQEVFDIRGSLAGLSLAANVDGLDEFLAKLRDVQGTASETAAKMDAGLGGSFRLLVSAVEGAMNALGAAMNDGLKPLVDRITAAINATTAWIERNAGLVTAFAATVAGAAALVAALLALGLASKGLGAATSVLSGAIGGLSSLFSTIAGAGSTLRTSLTLLIGSFADYRNAAMPAMVGTSRLLAALNLPIDSRAKQIAASLVLMNRAETAAAAKTFLAAKFQAAATALKGFSAATLASTLATKAHAAALWVATAGTQALAAVRGLAASVTAAFSLANVKAAATAGASTIANLALAASAKVVAAGYLAASAAATAFMSIPITWVLVAIVGGLAALTRSMAKAEKHTASLSDAMQKLREAGDENRKTDQLRAERLQQLAEKHTLTNAEMAEAQKLTKALEGRYGSFGAVLDSTTNSISLAADAMERLNASMKAKALGEVESEIAEVSRNIAEMRKESDSLGGFWSSAWNVVTFDSEADVRRIDELGDKTREAMARLVELKHRREAILKGEHGSLTGDADDISERIQETRSRAEGDRDEAERAAQRAAEIEERLAREQRTALENQIHDIHALRDEYKALVATMLDYEDSRADRDEDRIAELEEKLAQADRDAERRVAAARQKAADELARDVSDLQTGFEEQAAGIARRREEKDTDLRIDETLASDRDAGIRLLRSLMGQAQSAALAAKDSFSSLLADAQSDGTIDEGERDALRGAQDEYTRQESLLNRYAERLRKALEGVEKTQEKAERPFGAFYAKAVEAFGGRDVQQKMLSATEKTADNTKKTYELIRKGGLATTFA